MSRNPQQARRNDAPEQRFSEVRALHLCEEVEKMESLATVNEGKLGEALRSLAEVLVYNDKHNEAVVDKVLMERDLMTTLERLATNAMLPASVKIYVLQCVTMLLQNLTRISSVYFLCSNNRINRMIAVPVDEDDDELVSMYVSFLKSLALRLNKDTVQFFFETDTGAFPLFGRAVKLLHSTEDPMVRAATRQIVVCVAQIGDEAVQKFLYGALVEVYEALVQSMRRQLDCTARIIPWLRPGEAVSFGPSTFQVRPVVVLVEDIMDDVLYLNDLYRSAPSTTIDEAALRRVVECGLLIPMKLFLEDEVAACAGGGGANTSTEVLQTATTERILAPPSAALGFVARWARCNEVGALRDAFVHTFLDSPRDGEPCLLSRLLDACPHLSPALLLLQESLVTRRDTPAAEEGVSTAEAGESDLSAPPPQGEAVNDEQLWDSADEFLRAVDVPKSAKSDTTRHEEENATTHRLLRLLHRFLTIDVHTTALNAVMVLLRQIGGHLSPSALRCFASVALRLCKIGLQRTNTLVYQPILASLAGGASTPSAGHLAGAQVLDEWLENNYYVKGLGVTDVHLVAFLEARKAWDVFTRSGTREAVLGGGYDDKDIAPLLPLMPCVEDSPLATRWDAPTREAYLALQRQVKDAVSLGKRSASDAAEKARARYLVWFVVSQFHRGIWSEAVTSSGGGGGEVDSLSLEDTLTLLQRWHEPHTLYTWDRADKHLSSRLMLRCQVVCVRCESSSPTVPPGTALYLTLTPMEILFLAPPEPDRAAMVAEVSSGTAERAVVLSFDIVYVRAAMVASPTTSFHAVVQGLFPGKEMEVHLAFKDAEAAVLAVTQMNKKASHARKQAASRAREWML